MHRFVRSVLAVAVAGLVGGVAPQAAMAARRAVPDKTKTLE